MSVTTSVGQCSSTPNAWKRKAIASLKLNIGNPAPFGFEAPEEILQDVIRNLPTAQGYSDSKGLFSARKAIMQYYQQSRWKASASRTSISATVCQS